MVGSLDNYGSMDLACPLIRTALYPQSVVGQVDFKNILRAMDGATERFRVGPSGHIILDPASHFLNIPCPVGEARNLVIGGIPISSGYILLRAERFVGSEWFEFTMDPGVSPGRRLALRIGIPPLTVIRHEQPAGANIKFKIENQRGNLELATFLSGDLFLNPASRKITVPTDMQLSVTGDSGRFYLQPNTTATGRAHIMVTDIGGGRGILLKANTGLETPMMYDGVIKLFGDTVEAGTESGDIILYPASGFVRPSDDNLRDLGTVANRFRTGRFGTSVVVGSSVILDGVGNRLYRDGGDLTVETVSSGDILLKPAGDIVVGPRGASEPTKRIVFPVSDDSGLGIPLPGEMMIARGILTTTGTGLSIVTRRSGDIEIRSGGDRVDIRAGSSRIKCSNLGATEIYAGTDIVLDPFTKTTTGKLIESSVVGDAFLPAVDARGNVGSGIKRWASVRAVTVTSGDFKFENDWYLTEDDNGIKLCRPDGSIAQRWT